MLHNCTVWCGLAGWGLGSWFQLFSVCFLLLLHCSIFASVSFPKIYVNTYFLNIALHANLLYCGVFHSHIYVNICFLSCALSIYYHYCTSIVNSILLYTKEGSKRREKVLLFKLRNYSTQLTLSYNLKCRLLG